MKVDNLIKIMGRLKICEDNNWDLADIRMFIMRECNYGGESQLSRHISKFKIFMENHILELKKGNIIHEILKKLEEQNNDKY